MDDTGGRGRREKIPSAKVKEQVAGKIDKIDDDQKVFLPTYVAGDDPRLCLEQKEISKTFDHSKVNTSVSPTTTTDFYTLSGPHVESKDRRYYIRAKRDPDTLYFHAAEAPPFYARFSDENHVQCQADRTESCFTRDMLGKTGEWGQYTTRANVFAREGVFCYEAKLVSHADNHKETPQRPLATVQSADRTRTDRGSLRLGFCRREHMWSEVLGVTAYSYAVATHSVSLEEYGNVRFNSQMSKVKPINPGNLKSGDVVGLMITLPPLDVHKKVVEGTFDPAEYPELSCGPVKYKPKKGSKPGPKSDSGKGKEKADGSKKAETTTIRHQIRANLAPLVGINIPIEHDILRDRNPFIHKGVVYFECPDYTQRADLLRPLTRGKTVNVETGRCYDAYKDAHPFHEVPHLRTLPGSKIEMWVNGRYHGVVWENLLGFLPPASTIEKSTKTANLYGDVDDGQLGYYPAVSHYSGGAVEVKFDGNWWFGFEDGPAHPEARPFGDRYEEQIIEDFVCDLVDEIYMEELYKDPDWMKKRVLANIDLAPIKQEG